MWFEKIVGLVIGQIALALLLAVVLGLLWARLRREQHLGFWSLSWLASAAYIASVALYVVAHEKAANSIALTDLSLFGVAIGWFQPGCMILAAWSLRAGHVTRRQAILTFSTTFLLGAIWSGGGWVPEPDAFRQLQLIVAPRTLLDAAGLACYALFFRRYYSRARSFSGWLTIGFCLAYSVHLLLVTLGDIGIRVYGDPNGLLNSTVATILPMGITLGIVISVLEQAEHAEGAVRSIWESPVAMRLTDSQGFVVRVNPAFCAIMGRPCEQLEGRLFSECYDRAIAGTMLGRYRERFASRTIEPRVRNSFQRWDGQTVEAELTNVFVETAAGPHVLSLLQDTTREHDATDALQRSEERLKLLLASITDAVFDLRTDQPESALQPQFLKMLGYGAGELEETFDTWLALLHPDDRAAVPANPLDGIANSVGLSQWEYRLRHKSGRWVWVRSQARVIERDSAGRPLRIVGTITDVSEFKAAEAEARRLESELLQSHKMEAIGRLAGGIAHDFNNLLTVINGYSHAMLAGATPADPNTRRLDQIHKAGLRAAGLTQQLLAFSRRQVIAPRNVNLNGVVGEVLGMLHSVLGENIEIETVLAQDLAQAVVDPDQMHQVIMNLALNARDAMPRGGLLRLETRNVELGKDQLEQHAEMMPGPYILLAVSDTGEGMDAATLKSIFEPFFTTKERGRGTGLGLSTVHGIVRQSGGWIRVESEAGKGTTFKIYLPQAANPGERTQTPGQASEPAAGEETILLVEDQDDVREFAYEVLAGLGYRVLAAGSAEEALQVSQRHTGRLDLLVTDVVLPKMNGPQLAQRMQTERPELKVLYTSGYTDNEVVHRGALQPGFAFLPKPFTLEGLAAKVREAMVDAPV